MTGWRCEAALQGTADQEQFEFRPEIVQRLQREHRFPRSTGHAQQLFWTEDGTVSDNAAYRPRMVDLFCGCGGLSLGLEQAGFRPVFATDIDLSALETYRHNRSIDAERVVEGDIAEINQNFIDYAELVQGAELVCGGPPCQGFSMANRQRIIDDPRNALYREYLTFLQNVQPPFFLMENVKGMRNRITEILADMGARLGPDYAVGYDVLNAADFGVPQNRERLFIIGNRMGVDPAVLFADIAESRNCAPQFTLRDAIADLPELLPNRTKNRSSIENDEIGYVERDYEYEHTPYYEFINGGREVRVLSNHKNRYNNDRDIEIYSTLPEGANSLHPSIADIMPYGRRNHIFKDKYYKLRYDDVCKTITSHMKFDCNMYIHPAQSRGLSPREAARIQTFPDDYVFYGPQNGWYKQIGNAVPVKLAEAIGRQIVRYLT